MTIETEAEVVTAIKAMMMPQIDKALSELLASWSKAMTEASQSEIDRCIHIAEMCRTDKRGPSWNEAIAFVVESLRAWKTDSAKEPNGEERKDVSK